MRQPTGTVTMLFTDIEGSTKLLRALGRDAYGEALRKHQRLLRDVWQRHAGYEVDTEGDAFFVTFAQASQALAAARDVQHALAETEWTQGHALRVRIGIHSGEAAANDGKYVGVAVHRAARIAAAAHGGQVLVSQTTADLCTDEKVSGVALRDLGLHRLKDLTEPQRLYQLVAEGLPGDFASPRTLENRPTNLPTQPTPLIGREWELAELGELLARDEVRLVTLTGSGGIGKTRLALQAAAEQLEAFADGVYAVALAPVADPELVVPTIARTVDVRETPGQSLRATLDEYLRDRAMLLVLDNFEQLLEAAPAVGELLAMCPKVKALVTSRAPLHLSGEREYAVPPLAIPGGEARLEPVALSQYESVALFAERAQAVNRDFVLSDENAAAVAEICVKLDGLPLALELAAARVRVLPPAALLARLDRSLRVLTGGAKDLPTRQQTLRATIDWSFNLLSRDEQRLFAVLSVFVSGCTLEAVDAVCAADVDLEIDVLDGLTSLVEKSLLRQREVDGEARFSMLETVREYAAERLDERSGLDAIRRAHAEYFKRLAEAAAGGGHGRQQHAWLSRLEREQGNLRAALAFWRCDPESQLVIAHSVYALWWRGRWDEGRRWLEEGLAASSAENTTRLRALSDAYYLAYVQNDDTCARSHLDELLALSKRLGDRESTAAALHGLAMLAFQGGDDEGAAALEEESLAFAEGKRYSLFPLSSLAWDAFFRSDYGRARDYTERSIAVCREFDDESELAEMFAILAIVEAVTGRTQEAFRLLNGSLAVLRKLDNTPGLILRVLPGFAILRSVEGDTARALKLIGASEALRAQLGASGGRVAASLMSRVVEAAGKRLNAAAVESALADGGSLTLDEALALAAEAPVTSETALALPRSSRMQRSR